jgi:hypothetical protein
MSEQQISVPSQRKYIIREQTGADDEILTSLREGSRSEVELVDRFLTSIITGSIFEGKEVPVSLLTVQTMPVRDRYCILVKSRIFSLGKELKFEFDFGEPFGKEPFVEDLENYVWDYEKPFPKRGDLDFLLERIPQYYVDPYLGMKFHLTSGKQIKLKYLDGLGEGFMSKVNQVNPHVNQELIARDLAIMNSSGEYQAVLNFGVFTARDMAEIRSFVKAQDSRFDLISNIEHPSTGETIQVPILSLPDFFFPSLL